MVKSLGEMMEDAKKSIREEEEDKAKKPAEKKKNTRKRGKTARPKQPPARIEPGWIHYDIANAILRFVGNSFEVVVEDPGTQMQKSVAIDVGLPKEEDAPEEVEEREPAELLARIIAHVFHRTPGLKTIEKRLEGRDAKSGIGSDVAALLMQLYRRNKHLIPIAIEYLREEAQKQKKAKATAQKGGTANGAATAIPLADERG